MKELRSRYYHPHRIGECKIEYGIGCSEKIGDELGYLDCSRAMLLAGPNGSKSAAADRIRTTLGDRLVAEYDNCQVHAPIETTYEIAEIVNEEHVDVIVTVGGGSTSDTAKGVTCMLGEGKPLEELASRFTPPDTYVENYMKKPKIPIISVATMLGGAEIAPGFGAIDRDGRKIMFRGDYVTVRVLMLDPTATLDVNLKSFNASCFNGLAHGMEGLYSRSRTPITDALCKEQVRLFSKNMELLAAQPDDLDVRMQLLWAGTLGGMIVTNARVGFQHGLAHSLGATLMISHGLANAISLVPGVRFNLEVAAEEIASAALAMGIEGAGKTTIELAEAGLERIEVLKEELGIPRRLGALPEAEKLGLGKTIDGVTSQIMANRVHMFNPCSFGPDDVSRVLTEMW